ncbi:MAG: nucleotidyltransferase domain-containing protein [Acidobacteriota bacterium]|nr:nucleotidyltransferase domain-containing protein [Acidobacteriota bacterium]
MTAASGVGGRSQDDATALLPRFIRRRRRLQAVLLHGSWVRGEATAASDVDVLIVVDESVELDRALYRLWDAEPMAWQGRPVDGHFVRVPKEETFSGLWADAATHGQVLFDRDGSVSAHLLRVRQAIAESRLVRRVARGKPYWAESV